MGEGAPPDVLRSISAQIWSCHVAVLPLSHRMGEGRGEGPFPLVTGCRLVQATAACLAASAPESCVKNGPGLPSGSGGCCDRGGWRGTSFAVSTRSDLTFWISTVSKRKSESSPTAFSTVSRNSKPTIEFGMHIWRHRVSFRSGFGTHIWHDRAKERRLQTISGASFRSERRILKMWPPGLSTGAGQTRTALTLTLSHPMGEGRRPHARKISRSPITRDAPHGSPSPIGWERAG